MCRKNDELKSFGPRETDHVLRLPTGVTGSPRSPMRSTKSSPAVKQPANNLSNIARMQSLFGGAVTTTIKVRSPSTKPKKCLRSKINRCVTHRCLFHSVKRKKRKFKTDQEGKTRLVDEWFDEWVCEKSLTKADREQLTPDSELCQESVAGGTCTGERFGDDTPCGQETDPTATKTYSQDRT